MLVVAVLPEGDRSVPRGRGQVAGAVGGDVRAEAESGDVAAVLGQDGDRGCRLQAPHADDLVARAGSKESEKEIRELRRTFSSMGRVEIQYNHS